MDTVSTFAKTLSSDSSLAHAGVSSEVIVCASSVAMALTFDAGGEERQENFWVGDLTKDEAQKLLGLHGQEDRKDEFLDACPCAALFALFCRETHHALSGQPLNPLGGYRAMDLASTCERYAKVGAQALKAKKADMKKNAYNDVEIFLRDCKFQTVDGITTAGKNILNALLSQKSAGGPSVGEFAGGSGVLARDVAMWMREKGRHPVIWHTKDREYQFASELHANAATEILKRTSQSTPRLSGKKGAPPKQLQPGPQSGSLLHVGRKLFPKCFFGSECFGAVKCGSQNLWRFLNAFEQSSTKRFYTSRMLALRMSTVLNTFSAAMALSFDAGGDQRQKNYWVEDLTDDEAKEFLALRGHREDWEQFAQACDYRAVDLDLTCGDYKGPATLAAKKEEMKAKAAIEVQRFLDSCTIKDTAAGRKILEALMTDRNSSPGEGVDELSAGSAVQPRDVALWIRDNKVHPAAPSAISSRS
ncbi:unnamed protein product [Symbiodinium sp. CCMP2592]|nr:unnamed protein product [Symbiodinium sp. CCMP2592]